ncbi:MAG: riboflavin synthase [Candidatus Omnitrophota bacterium]
MFTGIIEELGIVRSVTKKGNYTVLEIQADKILGDVQIGDSVAVNGACLTVVKQVKDYLSFEVMEETLKLTNLGELHPNDVVNLERALKVGDRLSGHFVSGHIDAKSLIRKKTFVGENLCFEINIPKGLNKYISHKGSVAIDGISLTVTDVRASSFCVYIIPHTLKNTTFKYKNAGSSVNIEADLLAKYVLNA